MPASQGGQNLSARNDAQTYSLWLPRLSGLESTPVDPPPAGPPPMDDSVRFQHTFMCEQEMTGRPAGGYSQAEAVRQATDFDVISCQTRGTTQPQYDTPTLAAMRAANPRLKVYCYSNGGATNDTTLTEAAYGHNALTSSVSTRCKNPTWGTIAGEPSSTAWQAYIVQTALDRFALNPQYDGVFLDVMGDYPIALGIVNPVTGAKYTSAAFYALTASNAKRVQDALPAGKTVIANGLNSGAKWPTSKRLVTEPAGVRKAMPEGFTRHPTDTGYMTPAAWQLEITMLTQAIALGVGIYSATKVWGATDPNEERLRFGFGSMMLVDDGSMALFTSLGQSTTTTAYPWQGVNYGVPLGAYTTPQTDVHVREFSRSTLIVNVSASAYTATVNGTATTVPAHCSRWVTKGPTV